MKTGPRVDRRVATEVANKVGISPLWQFDLQLAETVGETLGSKRATPYLLAGVDEVGRGPLAGNVVAACVFIDPRSTPIDGLNDSKKLSEARREALAPRIREQAVAFAIGEATVAEIESLNILHASLLAMRRAVEGALADLTTRGNQSRGWEAPDLILVDGNRPIPGVTLPQRTVVGGDGLSASIAAASILAKIARDHAMLEADTVYPQYGFARHKGYATADHRQALRTHGPCPLHRLSFSSELMNSFQSR